MVSESSTNNYENTIKEAINTSNLSSNSTETDLTGTYLFVSFDLVNSTAFKNTYIKWGEIFNDFYFSCTQYMKDLFDKIEPWKNIGDEKLFYITITSEQELYDAPSKIYDVLEKLIIKINKNQDIKGMLSIKATLWCAVAKDKQITTDKNENIILKENDFDDIKLDFLGPDIDIGFRISEFALSSFIVIDAKLAYLLTSLETKLGEPNISDNMRIVSYEQLKGVWNNRYYPIVWYHKKWSSLNDLFTYDEKFNSEIVYKIQDSNGDMLDNVSALTKIFNDLNKISEIQALKDGIVTYNDNNPSGTIRKKIERKKLSEIHLVAICFNQEKKILIAKRANKDVLSDKWEFGCSQLKINSNFLDSLKEGYKQDFGIDIDFLEEKPLPIGIYYFIKPKENNRIVPGLIFVCKTTNNNDIQLDETKHTEYEWIDKENSNKINSDEAIEDFHKRIEDAYNYYDNINKLQSKNT